MFGGVIIADLGKIWTQKSALYSSGMRVGVIAQANNQRKVVLLMSHSSALSFGSFGLHLTAEMAQSLMELVLGSAQEDRLMKGEPTKRSQTFEIFRSRWSVQTMDVTVVASGRTIEKIEFMLTYRAPLGRNWKWFTFEKEQAIELAELLPKALNLVNAPPGTVVQGV